MKQFLDYLRNKYLEKNFILLFYILILFLLLTGKAIGQTISSTTYPMVSSTGVGLVSYTSMGTLVSSGNDDTNSSVTNIGFDFWFNGVRYTQFGVNSNGHLKLGSTVTSINYINNLANGTENPKIAPYWDDLTTGSDGYVKYGLVGSAPNRRLVVEWKTNVYVNNATVSNAAPLLFQAILSESTGAIQYIYGGTIATSTTGYSIGFSTSSTNLVSVASSSNVATYGSDPNTNQTASIAAGKSHVFTPQTPNAPSNLTFANVATTSMTLNWSDNASNEQGYVIYTSTDGVNYVFNQQVAANDTNADLSGLTTNTTYYFKVYAITEGTLSSPPLTGSQTTPVQVVITTGASTWVAPACVTSVTIETWGAGGGGGSSNNTNTNGGSGGGGGAYAKGIHTVVPGSTYFYSVGIKGSGGPANSTTPPTAGGSTWFNAVASTNVAPASDVNGTLAAGGGPGVNNSITTPSNAGLASSSIGNVTVASGSAGLGGTTAGGRNGGAGASPGGGAGGAGSRTTNGSNGTTPGGGGGGGNDKKNNKGGDGAIGQIIITYTNLSPSAVPVISSPICSGSTTLSGTSSEANGTIIELFKAGISLGTTTVTSGTWTKIGLPSLVSGDVITATAVAPSCKTVSVSSVSVTVTGAPTPATNSSTQTICSTSTATLSGNVPTVGTAAWSVVSGPSTLASQFSSLTSPTAVFTPAGGAGSYVVRWTISNSPCTASTANATITVTGAPTTATNSSTQTICSTATATLSGNAPTVGTGAWSVVSGPSTLASQFSSLTNPTAVFTPAGGVGSYVVRWTISNASCAASTANATITVTGAPTTATNSSTQTICSTATATLSGNAPTVGTGAWSVVSGPSTLASQFSSLTNPAAVFTPAGGVGSYVVRWTISNAPCAASTANATITVTGAPTTAMNSSTQTICSTSTATLSANAPTVGTGAWSVVSGPSTLASQFSSLTNPTAVFTPAGGAGSYVVRWTISNLPCTASTANATITVTGAPTIATNSSTQTICATATATLSGNAPTVGTGAWSVVSGPSTLLSQFSSLTNPAAVFTPAGGVGSYVVRWTISNSPCTASTANATITVGTGTVGGAVTGGSSICSGSTSGLLTLSGHIGSVIRWESSVSPFSSWTPIATTSTTYTSGVLTQDTQFRAVVQSGSCSIVNSTPTTVSLGSTTTWNGSSWSNGVPTSISSAIISGNYNSSLNGGNITACSLTVTNGIVIISSGNNVSLNGALQVLSGSFTLENNANLIQSSTVVNSGNIIVKRNTSPLIRQDYVLWSSPVAAQQLLAFSPATLTNRFYTYDSATDKYIPVFSPATTNFALGTGYLIRVPNTHPTTPTIWGGQFTGVPNNGTVNLTVANATYNAIGNPYPSTIDADTFIAANGITEALYFWRKTNNSNNSSYATYTTAGGVSNSGGDTLGLTPSGTIAVGQGFIVKSTSTTISFTNAMRVANSNAPFLRVAENRNRIWLNLSSTSGAFYQTMVSYMPNATSAIDATIDGRFLKDTQTALISLIDNEEFAIQGRALPFDPSDVVLLGFKAKVADTYTITLSNFDGLFTNGQAVYLKDKLTNIIHDLKSGSYVFASEAGTFNERFEIVYQNALATHQTSFTENSVVVYKQNQELVINTGTIRMSNVQIYDVTGRLLMTKNNINDSQIKIYTGTTKEVLLVKITSETEGSVLKKIIN